MLDLARSRFAGRIVAWLFSHMPFAIPVKRLRETKTLIAFRHPEPRYAFHILIVPKKALAGLTDLAPVDTPFLADLFATVKSLVEEFDLESNGYRLVANGGRYQYFPHLHFHLIGGPETS